MEEPSRQLYALLFHPEVAHTDYGLEILRNFAYNVCGCTGDWTIASFIEEATAADVVGGLAPAAPVLHIVSCGGTFSGRVLPHRHR